MYFDSPYYLGPAEGAEKAYSLLARAMQSSGKAAIARFVFRNKEHLAALRSDNGVLTLTTMRFADEVVPPDELDDVLPDKKPKVAAKEVEMAEKLIDSLTSDRRQGDRRPGGARAAGDQGAGFDGGSRGEHRRRQRQAGRQGQDRRQSG